MQSKQVYKTKRKINRKPKSKKPNRKVGGMVLPLILASYEAGDKLAHWALNKM